MKKSYDSPCGDCMGGSGKSCSQYKSCRKWRSWFKKAWKEVCKPFRELVNKQ